MVSVNIIVDGKERKLYADRWLATYAVPKIHKALNRKDKDRVSIVDGEEGSGKSVFAMQYAKLVDPSFCLDRVCMNAEQFTKALTNAKKGQAIVYDEAFTGLSSRSALSQINKLLVEYMMEMRQNNLFVIVCMPTVFLLDKYVALWRAKELFHIYTKNDIRGFWCYFNKKKKKQLYLYGKKEYSYAYPKSVLKGRFFDTYVVDEDAYRAKKCEALKGKKRESLSSQKYLKQRNIVIRALFNLTKITQEQFVKILDEAGYPIVQSSVAKILKKGDDNKKV